MKRGLPDGEEMSFLERGPVFFGDLLGRIGIVGFFTFAAVMKFNAVRAAFANLTGSQADFEVLRLISGIANLAFLVLIVMMTVFRLKPLKSQDGLEPRITALAGTFAMILLTLMPPAVPVPPAVVAIAIVLLLIGCSLSAFVMIWLGRSFSIMPEARRLVTRGPYAIVRHPLYSAEEIAIIGTLLLNLSIPAVLLVAVQWMLQLRRMHNEEQVLRSAFADYDQYAARTPKFFPQLTGFLGLKKSVDKGPA